VSGAATGTPIAAGPEVVPALAGQAAYDPGPAPAVVRLRLDRNEGPPPPLAAGAALAGLDPEAMRRYASAGAIEARIAARNGLDPAQVIVTNGGDEGIDRCCRLMLAPGRRAIVHDPTFEMIERSARLAGAGVTRVPWERGAFPREAFLAAATAGEGPARLLAVVTPNNPTGLTADLDDVLALADACPRAMVLVDAAYVEFHDPAFPAAVMAAERANIVLVRTFSKAWGLAGLRCGWLAGPAPLIAGLRAAGGPYAVGGGTQAVIAALLDAGVEPDVGYLRRVAAERDALADACTRAGAFVPASRANFVTPVFPSAADAARVADGLAADGIAVRRFGGDRATGLRITCPGDAADWAVLRTSLATHLGVAVPDAVAASPESPESDR
jgi:histidinol-phosphate aminotransferase